MFADLNLNMHLRGMPRRAAIALSEDHKPNRADERQRIEGAGGMVIWAGTWRVGGILAGENPQDEHHSITLYTL